MAATSAPSTGGKRRGGWSALRRHVATPAAQCLTGGPMSCAGGLFPPPPGLCELWRIQPIGQEDAEVILSGGVPCPGSLLPPATGLGKFRRIQSRGQPLGAPRSSALGRTKCPPATTMYMNPVHTGRTDQIAWGFLMLLRLRRAALAVLA